MSFNVWKSLIDGTEIDVSAIPDSAVLYIDASQHDVSDGSTVSTAPDFSGESNDLSGTATYRSDGIGGEAAYEFDGVDDVLSRETPAVPQPLTIITVVEPFSASGRQVIFSSQDDGGERAQFTARFDDNEYTMFAGSSFAGGTPIAEPQVAVLVADGTNSFVRINGSEIASGDIGGHDWGGFKIGQRFGSSDELEGYQPEVLVADERLDTSTIEEEEQRLSDKYSISLE